MPRRMEKALKLEAMKKFPGDKERQDRYVYGTMNKLGKLKKQAKHGNSSNERIQRS